MKPSGKKVTRKGFVNHLRNRGFSPSDAEKAVDALLEVFEDIFTQGHELYLPRLLKMTPRVKKPYTMADNLHGRKILFGERLHFKTKVLALKSSNLKFKEDKDDLRLD